ncbi:aminotransferase class I/II-fold pyridoxal phosphate-dependent enzyme [Acidipropionibacterium virtanenii]|uniref:Putative N-succinyldiaminopimelate aminotransferase DapC n=1 Tax=Acidipropionibacterium virtanenii TaxID=2057246 RepID=A0A344UQD2_9ACTN|nr:aminotransferase class I/II-fold pyridoxal phosphate-dependent enzyme [Acidipropionibacterium virtanenii]AXE37480.1 putative N-succinyldiaminopimelate aminotransferase DapC [Acidipropionibacterium virtanenii]
MSENAEDLRTPAPITGPWRRTAAGAGLLAADGRVAPTIFTEMTALATATGALNLGQGFPDDPGPAQVLDAAGDAIAAGRNQYPPLPGIPGLRTAIAAHQKRFYGLDVDPDTEIQVTMGATEAMAATLLALVEPGQEVVTIDPFYDAYAAVIALAAGVQRPAPLTLDRDAAGRPTGFRLDLGALRQAVTDRTRAIIVNTPHNPTGTMLGRADLEQILAVAKEHGAYVITDEVYEHLTFAGPHVPMASLPGARGTVISISSAGKTFSVTGWKIGWITAAPELVTAIRTVKQFLTFAGGGPFQTGVAAGLGLGDEVFDQVRESLKERRDLLVSGLRSAGFDVVVPDAGYFTVADAAPLGFEDGAELCRQMPEQIGVAAVPVSAFTSPAGPNAARMGSLVRFAHCKSASSIHQAVERLQKLQAPATMPRVRPGS